jgi:hypothetical protein
MSSDRTNPSQGSRRGTFKPLSEDVAQLYTMLNNQRRRLCILAVDRRCDPPHDLRPIAREITARINETTLAQARGEEYQKVYVPLIQGHLDQLDEADILRYNEPRKTVAPGPKFRVAVALLNVARSAYGDP